MAWTEVTVLTASAGIELAAAGLTAGGFSELVLEDEAEFTAFLENNRDYWDYIDEQLQEKLKGLSRIVLYVQSEAELADLNRVLDKLRAQYPAEQIGSLAVQTRLLPETNWDESWKDNYPPQYIGRRLAVIPYWLDVPQDGRIPVILDPGLTFGTGAHPSTRMAMEALEEHVFPGCRVIDLGSGSGILSLAALRLGAKSAVGVDVDPKAEHIARENAAYNGFSAPEFTACTGNVCTDQMLMARLSAESYDLVLVNIVADVIIALCPVLPRFMGRGSKAILSGILDERFSDVAQAVTAAGLRIVHTREAEGWRCICAERSEL